MNEDEQDDSEHEPAGREPAEGRFQGCGGLVTLDSSGAKLKRLLMSVIRSLVVDAGVVHEVV